MKAVMSWDRVGLVVGGVTCLLVTPFFALAYYPAFASFGEVPPPWAAWLTWPEIVTGDPVMVYNTYGTVFGIALLVVVVSLASLVRDTTAPGSSVRRSWGVVVGGLAAVAVGSILEYGFEILSGFLIEIVGFLILIVGMITLGFSLRRDVGSKPWKSLLVGVSGLAAVVVGVALVGHLPSGPAFVPVAASVLIGLTGLPFAATTISAPART